MRASHSFFCKVNLYSEMEDGRHLAKINDEASVAGKGGKWLGVNRRPTASGLASGDHQKRVEPSATPGAGGMRLDSCKINVFGNKPQGIQELWLEFVTSAAKGRNSEIRSATPTTLASGAGM